VPPMRQRRRRVRPALPHRRHGDPRAAAGGPAMASHTSSLTASQSQRAHIQVWDWPLRLFHGSLVVAVPTAVLSGRAGGDWMRLHGWAGQAILGLVVFRLVWGLIGASHARFVTFAPTPRRLAAYLRGRWQGVGHNPLGALSVLALLALLTTQAVSGLFANDDIAFAGPLASRVADALSSRLTGLHHRVADLLLILIGLHLLAIAAHAAFKRVNLVTPMLTGRKEVDAGRADQASRPGRRWALGVALVAALAAVYLSGGGGWAEPVSAPAPATAPAAAW
jgi:cytochrome b